MHYLSLFLPDPNNDPDMNLADMEAEIEQGFARQKCITDWLNGKAPLESVFDHFADQGIDSYEWENVMANAIERVISDERIIEDFDVIQPVVTQ